MGNDYKFMNCPQALNLLFDMPEVNVIIFIYVDMIYNTKYILLYDKKRESFISIVFTYNICEMRIKKLFKTKHRLFICNFPYHMKNFVYFRRCCAHECFGIDSYHEPIVIVSNKSEQH